MRRHIPNLLSVLRLAGLPVLVWLALGGQRNAFFALLIASQFTDFLDGYLARKLNAQSRLGGKLDILGDSANYIAGVVGLGAFYPELLSGPRTWLVAGFALLYGLRFAVARQLTGEWIHPVGLVSAKVNFHTQSLLVLALATNLHVVPWLLLLALATGTLESLAYLRSLVTKATAPGADAAR